MEENILSTYINTFLKIGAGFLTLIRIPNLSDTITKCC